MYVAKMYTFGTEVLDMTGQIVGYARVSSTDQHLDRQLAALGDVDKLFTDHVSGGTRDRPGLDAMMSYVREGDVLRVTSIDRIARSARDLLDIIDELTAKGVKVEFIDSPSLNTDRPEGRLVLTILGAVAEMERQTIRERQAEGIAAAKARGVYERPPKLNAEQVADVRRRAAMGVPKALLAREMGCSRSTIYKAIKGEGVYAERNECTTLQGGSE